MQTREHAEPEHPRDAIQVSESDPATSAFASAPTALSAWPNAHDHGSDEDLYTSSVVGRPGGFLQPGDTGRLDLLPPLSEGPSSRRSSMDSHSSKDSTWHPSKEPEPEYVAQMLAKPFAMDPIKGVVDIEKATFYFKRAFQ